MSDSKGKINSKKTKSVLVLTSFEVEIVGRVPYTSYEEVDLAKLESKFLIEDCNENENSPEDKSSHLLPSLKR